MSLKRAVSITLILVFIFSVFPRVSAEEFDVTASSAVLINVGGEIIWGKNENEKLPVASTTKIMTALLASETENLYEDTPVSPEAIKVEGTSMGLKEGDRVSCYDLIVGMLLSSGNDAANEAAKRISGSLSAFSDLMNERAKEIGMKNTNFVTPSGLHHEEHYSTAYDMALLGAASLENPLFRSVCSSKSITISYGSPPYRRTLYNHNKLLTMGDGYIGIKTGYTRKAGRCLVSACEREGVVLIAVTLKASNDWEEHQKLYDYGFSLLKEKTCPREEFSLRVYGGDKENLKAFSAEERFYFSGEEPIKKVFLPEGVYAPVKKGDKIGSVSYFSGDKEIYSAPITAGEDIKAKEKAPSLFKRLIDFFCKIFKLE